MKVETWPIERVTPYARNPRKNAGAVATVARSLREFGFRQPIVVDAEGVVVVGHTRLMAAASLGLTEVPVHVATGLTPEQITAYRIADNRTAQESEWDNALLSVEMADLKSADYDLSLTGFNPDEIEALFALDASGLLPGTDADDVPEPPDDPITKLGDVITLGAHRLVCGDSTDAGAWAALMSTDRADLIWTDPPYGVSYGEKNAMLNRTQGKGSQSGSSRIETPIENDSMTAAELRDFLRAALSLAWSFCRDGGGWYVAAPAGPPHFEFATVLSELEVWRHTLNWVKDGFVLGRSDYHYRHEPIFYGWKEGTAHTWNGGRSQDSCLEIPRPRANRVHPTMKPVALIRRCVENSSNEKAIVCDPFGGSGSTMIACEEVNRRARLMELSPAYCDVIVTRWEQATGKRAVR